MKLKPAGDCKLTSETMCLSQLRSHERQRCPGSSLTVLVTSSTSTGRDVCSNSLLLIMPLTGHKQAQSLQCSASAGQVLVRLSRYQQARDILLGALRWKDFVSCILKTVASYSSFFFFFFNIVLVVPIKKCSEINVWSLWRPFSWHDSFPAAFTTPVTMLWVSSSSANTAGFWASSSPSVFSFMNQIHFQSTA